MDSFEINKIVAAILMVALLIIGIGKISDVIFYLLQELIIFQLLQKCSVNIQKVRNTKIKHCMNNFLKIKKMEHLLKWVR